MKNKSDQGKTNKQKTEEKEPSKKFKKHIYTIYTHRHTFIQTEIPFKKHITVDHKIHERTYKVKNN